MPSTKFINIIYYFLLHGFSNPDTVPMFIRIVYSFINETGLQEMLKIDMKFFDDICDKIK